MSLTQINESIFNSIFKKQNDTGLDDFVDSMVYNDGSGIGMDFERLAYKVFNGDASKSELADKIKTEFEASGNTASDNEYNKAAYNMIMEFKDMGNFQEPEKIEDTQRGTTAYHMKHPKEFGCQNKDNFND